MTSNEHYYRVLNLNHDDLTQSEVNKFKSSYPTDSTITLGNSKFQVIDIREQYGSLFICLRIN